MVTLELSSELSNMMNVYFVDTIIYLLLKNSSSVKVHFMITFLALTISTSYTRVVCSWHCQTTHHK